MKSIAALALSAGLVLATGCGSASPSAATIRFPAVAAGATSEPATSGSDSSATTASTAVAYGDTVTIDRSEFEKELKALHDNKQLQAASGGSGLAGAGKSLGGWARGCASPSKSWDRPSRNWDASSLSAAT